MKEKNALRMELEALTKACMTFRPATVRRSLKDHMLYATDLPCLLTDCELTEWIRMASGNGWRSEQDRDWLLLDHDIPDALPGKFRGPFGNEAGCCASLLRRQCGTGNGNDVKRRLVKAGEEGAEAYEQICRELHEEWAARLRKGEPLPAVPTDWFEKTLDNGNPVEYDYHNFIETVEGE